MSNCPRYKASSLIEVLVVLALIASTMVMATRLSIEASLRIKQDEVIDYANGIILEALEIAKTPQDIKVQGNGLTGNFDGSYYIDRTQASPVLVLESSVVTPISDCTPSSVFRLSVDDIFEFPIPEVCLQVIIDQLDEDLHLVTVNAFFRLVKNEGEVSIVGYRRAPFVTVEVQ